MQWPIGLFLLLLPLAGCTAPNMDRDLQPTLLSGAFTADRSEADLADFDATLAAHGVHDYALMESYPEQFRLELTRADCEGLRADLVHKEYLGHLTGCVNV